jgi:hypothetical protein
MAAIRQPHHSHPEQREVAKSMGVTEIEYAKQVQAFEPAKRDDPEKYGQRN